MASPLLSRAAAAVAVLTTPALATPWLACAPPPAPGATTVTTDDLAPTVATVRWTSPEPGAAWVEVQDEDGVAFATPRGATEAAEHEVVVLGLAEGRAATLLPVVETADGERIEGEPYELLLPPAPADVARFALAVDGAGQQQGAQGGGYVLTSTLNAETSWVVILDRLGRVVWYFPARDGMSVATARPGRDGRSVLMTEHDREQEVDAAMVVRMDLRGGQPVESRTVGGHHDFAELPDGRLAWLALDLRALDDPALPDVEQVIGDRIVVGAEGLAEGDPTESVYAFLDSYHPVWSPCVHFGSGAYGLDAGDWTHANSLVHDEASGTFLVGLRNLDAVVAIDAATGALRWQLGGQYATLEGEVALSHGHYSHAWEGGMLYFDNGVHHDPATSRVVELEWDVQAGTAREVWEYRDPEGRAIPMMGDARKLPGGNRLVSWSTAGLLTELTPAGEVVWQLEADLGHATGRLSWVADLYDLSATPAPTW